MTTEQIENLAMDWKKSSNSLTHGIIPEHTLKAILLLGYLSGKNETFSFDLQNPTVRARILCDALGKTWVDHAEMGGKIIDSTLELIEQAAEIQKKKSRALLNHMKE